MKKYLLFGTLLTAAFPAWASTEELIYSVKQNNLPAVIELLNKGENVNGTNAQGNTALHYAVALDNADITKALLAAGADINSANQTGWTPIKIAEKKDVKNVAALLQNAREKAIQESEEIIKIKESAVQQVVAAQKVAAQARKEAVLAQNAQLQAEQEITALKSELAKLQQEKQQTETALKTKLEQEAKLKAEQEAKLKAEQEAKLKAEQEKASAAKVKTNAIKSVPIKPVVNKQLPKPMPKAAPKPIARSKSTLNNNIFAGDEEIVYCLNYLGQGENFYMLRAAGYFAASAGISEARYKQIVNLSNNVYSSATDATIRELDAKCSKVITPQNTAKQNQIVRSVNKSIGY